MTRRTPSLIHGGFYVVTGLWPILHLRSFEAVTGPKVDKWLVKTIGGLIAAVGVALLVGSSERSRGLRVLGLTSAIALGAADVLFVARRRIRPVYLVDAAAEAGLTALWAVAK